MDRLIREERLPSMKLALNLRIVEAETEEGVETDAEEGATNDYFLASEMPLF
jgi:hypothetical protein